ncbi:mechanosensitive ion channel family protein [Vibrio zhugei]|uniref:Mechanosensitive ion channel family protein n=1 Tax=Vibrio zhugei TaxID=2479546 RepID=A0ABV7CAX7_9VIBR|nr:mechanosensitive ion channel family protein [Vibrio zhugei]
MNNKIEYLINAYPYLATAAFIVLALVVGFVVRFLVLFTLKYNTKRSNRFVFNSLQQHLKQRWFLFVPAILLHLGSQQLPLSPEEEAIFEEILQIIIVLSFAMIATSMVKVVEDVLFRRYDISHADNLKARKARTQIIYVKKVALVIITILAIGMILLNFDSVRQYGTTILTGAGVAGIIIGFALQKSLANLFSGIQIAFTQPIKIDDAVVVEGEWGWIEEINLTYVVVKIWDLRRLVLPITYFTENAFQNWTRNTAQILGAVNLYVDYSMPLEPLRQYFDEVLEGTEMWDKSAKAFQVTDCSEKTMTIRLLMTAKNSPMAWDLRCYVREAMIGYIQEHYPHSFPRVRAEINTEAFPPPKNPEPDETSS